MKCEATTKHKAIERDIASITDYISSVIKYLALVHDFSECDTIPAVYEQDKLAILKCLEKLKAVRKETDEMTLKADLLTVFLIKYSVYDSL